MPDDTQPCVLVVDDEPTMREVVAWQLTDAGYTVATAADGREALDQIAAQPPALVLLDLQMPVMSGEELLGVLRQHHPRIPVVVMSAGLRTALDVQCLGVDGHLAKPFEFEQLLELLRYLCP